MNTRSKHPVLLQMAAAALFILAAATIFPLAFTQNKSILGYYAVCPFSPISTIILLYSGVMVRQYTKRRVP